MRQGARDGFLRRLGRPLRGVNAVEYGRPAGFDDLEATSHPTPAQGAQAPARPSRRTGPDEG